METFKENSVENKIKDILKKDKEQFVTVVSVGTEKNNDNIVFDNNSLNNKNHEQNGFVTVLTIGDDYPAKEVNQTGEIIEEVLVYRLPGERLGFGLKFEGGTKTSECVRRLFIQSCAADSPASRVKCSWGHLVEGDEIIKIDSTLVKNMTRIDCVRCLKDSNVVISLLVKHSTQYKLNMDDDASLDELNDKKRDMPPPPPIPPRKLSKKLLNKEKMSPASTPCLDVIDVDAQNISKTIHKVQVYSKNNPWSRQHLEVTPKVPSRDRKLSDVSSGPPDAEVYLDLLAQELEYGIKAESESDDTGSTISTVIDKHNSIFLASNPSSIASDSIPSTPTAVQKQLDLSKVVNPFEMLEMEYGANMQSNDDFLFTRFVSSHDILLDCEQTPTDSKTSDCEKMSLIPPASFQDAPLSYGNEDVNNIINHKDDIYPTIKITEPIDSNDTNDNPEEFEHRIVEEIKIPTPVPRKCYTRKKLETQDTSLTSKSTSDTDNHTNANTRAATTEMIDLNLPRLVNFVPKVPPKSSPMSEMRYSFSDPDLQIKNDEADYHNVCLIKYKDHLDDFNYLYPNSSNYVECNNNECDKIISCSSWSLHSQLATIGESEEELDSLEFENSKKECSKTNETLLSEKETDKRDNRQEPLRCTSDNITLINNFTNMPISSAETFAMNHKHDHNQDNNIHDHDDHTPNHDHHHHHDHDQDHVPSIQKNDVSVTQLVEDNDETIKEEKAKMNEILATNQKKDMNETMDVSNFIQTEQQQAITTSEYSSLSSLSSPPLSFSSRLPPDGQEFPPTCQESQTCSDPPDTDQSADSTRRMSAKCNTTSWPKTSTSRNSTGGTTSANISAFWKRDQTNISSVKDKIAIFDRASDSDPPNLDAKENIAAIEPRVETMETHKEFAKLSLSHAASFSTKPNPRIHNRSQSLLDMSSLDTSWNNNSADSRRLTLNMLIEQRRKCLSKLRGLVIPQENQENISVVEPIFDLPEIHNKDVNLTAKVSNNCSKSDCVDGSTVHLSNLNSCSSTSSNLQSPVWKTDSLSSLPRYSPAFKRKCLQIYVNEQSSSNDTSISSKNSSPKTSDSVFHSDYETNMTSLSSIPSDDVFTMKSNNLFDSTDCEKLDSSKSSVMSSSDIQNDSVFCLNKSCSTPKEHDSDNDSAVSSSQSSYISRDCSPLPSPLQNYTSNASFIPTVNGNPNCIVNGISPRILKPQSVEAINRKNILASAKCRSGRDFKNGSPLIQRKLSDNQDDDELIKVEENFNDIMTYTKEANFEVQSNNINSDNVSTKMAISKKVDNAQLSPKIKIRSRSSSNLLDNIDNYKLSSAATLITPVTNSTPPINDIDKVVLRKTPKTKARHSSFDITDKSSIVYSVSSRYDSLKRTSVTDIRKQFEKFEEEHRRKSTSVVESKLPSAKHLFKSPFQKSKSSVSKNSPEPSLFHQLSKNPKKEVKNSSCFNFKMEKSAAITTLSKEELQQIVSEVNKGLDKNSALYVNENEVITVVLHREIAGGSIGITLTGGTDYEAKEITVHKVLTGSCAHKDGRLKKGDRILAINDKRMLGLTHKESVDILKDPKPVVMLVVLPCAEDRVPITPLKRTNNSISLNLTENIPPILSEEKTQSKGKLVRVELIKDGSGLGFSLDGGKDSPKGDKPLIIKKIFTGGAAEKCGQLQAGDELINVNEVDVLKMTRIEVWNLMKKLPDGKVSLIIKR